MKEVIDRYVEHAADALNDAEYLHQDGRALALANRAYYAICYCISASLLTEGVTTKNTRVHGLNSMS